MGFFSWLTADSKESIANTSSDSAGHPVRTVYLYLPEGGFLTETAYEGYGVFAGQDAYALLAKWNAPKECTGGAGDREVGIDLFFASIDGDGTGPSLEFPLKFSFSPDTSYSVLGASPICPSQGYFYDEDESDG